jgi:hypothetical protein
VPLLRLVGAHSVLYRYGEAMVALVMAHNNEMSRYVDRQYLSVGVSSSRRGASRLAILEKIHLNLRRSPSEVAGRVPSDVMSALTLWRKH